ncbi:TPA: hypothetical protein ACRLYD_004183 [Pseudomonas aeruginosa]
MAFLFASGDPRGEPKLTLEQDEFGKWEWRVWCPLGARPERQAQAYALAERLNSPTGRLRKHRHESLPPRTEEFMRGIVKEVVMSEVKKISPVGNIYGWEESQFGEFVLSQDYDDLAEEAQALREEVAQQKFLTKVENDALKMMTDKANELKSEVEQLEEELESLRARVVVVPERDARRMDTEYPEGWNDCLDELARLNGLAVSEGLLRRLLDSDGIDGMFDAQQNYAAHQELRALLSEQE